MIKWLNRGYSLLRLKVFLWQFCVFGPLITFFYILGIQPFGFSLFSSEELMRLALYFSAPPMLIWVLHLYVLRPMIIKRHTIKSTILYLLWINFVIGIYNYTFAELYIFGGLFDFYWLPGVLWRALLLGAVVAAILASTHAGWLMRRRIMKRKRDWLVTRVLEQPSASS